MNEKKLLQEKFFISHKISDISKFDFNFLKNKIICYDNLEVLNIIPDNSIDLIITSPPYFQQRNYDNLGIGNEENVEKYLENLFIVFRECVRIIKLEGNLVFNLGDKYLDSSLQLIPYRFALLAEKIENVKLINNITWIKTNPTPRQFRRRLVSSTEPFFHFVKGKNYYYDIDNFNKSSKKKNSTNKVTNIGNSYFGLIEESNLSEDQKQLAKKELNEVINEVRAGKIESFRMKIKGIHKEAFGGQEGGRKSQIERKGFTIIRIQGNGMKKDSIESAVETIKGCIHPAIYPISIIDELIKLLSPENGLVLDPFNGSGTTCVSAIKNNRNYIGIDINPDYCDFAIRRILSI